VGLAAPTSVAHRYERHRLDLYQYVQAFRAEHLGLSDSRTLAARAWPELKGQYRSFIGTYAPMLQKFKCGELNSACCFVTYLQSQCAFNSIIVKDPRSFQMTFCHQIGHDLQPRPSAKC